MISPECDGSGWIVFRVNWDAATNYDYPVQCRHCNENGEKS